MQKWLDTLGTTTRDRGLAHSRALGLLKLRQLERLQPVHQDEELGTRLTTQPWQASKVHAFLCTQAVWPAV